MLLEKKKSVIHFFSAIQAGKLYSKTHPNFKSTIEIAYNSLRESMENRTEMVIGMVDEEVACDEEIYFDLNQRHKSSILYLRDRNIEKIFIHKAFDKNELGKFVSLLSTSKKELQTDAQKFLAIQGIRNIRTGKIKDYSLLQVDDMGDWESLRKLYDSSINAYAQAMDNVLNLEEVDGVDVKFNLLNVMENFTGRHQEIMSLIEIKEKDLLTFVHLLNVAILAMHLSAKMGLTKDDVLDVGVSALFHDVGKIFISSKILRKKSKLTEREFTKIKDHAILGSRILCEYRKSLGYLPAVVAFEHHMRYDLSGYPRVPYSKRPYLASFIVSICDVYDALAQRRTYKKDSPPNEIYKIMIGDKGKLFHPEILDRFFEVTGVWPVGTIVYLNDKSVAVVREINESDIFSPKVEVISPVKKDEYIDLEKEKGKLKIEKAINPFGRGKDFIDFVKRRN